jgi:hypothetical protein
MRRRGFAYRNGTNRYACAGSNADATTRYTTHANSDASAGASSDTSACSNADTGSDPTSSDSHCHWNMAWKRPDHVVS